MTSLPAAPPERRRLSRGLFGALVAFLFLPFPPILLFGPVAVLLLIARPASMREWVWLALAAGITGLAFAWGPRTVLEGVLLAFAAVFTGGFTALILARGGPALRRAALAALLAAALVSAGSALLGITWPELVAAVRMQLQASMDLVVDEAALTADQLASIRAGIDLAGRLYPGLVVLGAMAGGTLAAAVVDRIAPRAAFPAPVAFRDFRFNDHLIWGALLTFGALVLPAAVPWRDGFANGMVVWAGLYLARGGAVAGTVTAAWPAFPRIALFLSAVLLLPYALGALLLVGVADTWIDIRRATGPSPSGGLES